MSDLRIGIAEIAPAVRPAMPRAERGGETFSEALGRVVDSVKDLQGKAQEAAVALASGQSVDMAQALVTIEEANVSLQLALQVRNKLLDAYQEIMRMPV